MVNKERESCERVSISSTATTEKNPREDSILIYRFFHRFIISYGHHDWLKRIAIYVRGRVFVQTPPASKVGPDPA